MDIDNTTLTIPKPEPSTIPPGSKIKTSNIEDDINILLTLAQKNDLTDGGETTLHSHAEPSSLGLDSTPDADHTVSGITAVLTADSAFTIGQVGYIVNPGRIEKAQANAAATSGVVAMCADATISQYATGNFLLFGFARDDTWTWTIGAPLYLSDTTAGGLTETAPANTDEVVKIVGRALTATIVLFNPEQTMIVHA
jgi:hypothetical protein